MDKFTTDRETDARSTRRARGEGFSPHNAAHSSRSTSDTPRRCAVCGASLDGRRRQTRYCTPTCCARASDARTGRTTHVATGKRPRRRRALEV